jgi:hypothetical protein
LRATCTITRALPHHADLARATTRRSHGGRRTDPATTTKADLKVESALDTATYEKGIQVSNAEMKTLDIQGDAFHPEWNYTIRLRSVANRSS